MRHVCFFLVLVGCLLAGCGSGGRSSEERWKDPLTVQEVETQLGKIPVKAEVFFANLRVAQSAYPNYYQDWKKKGTRDRKMLERAWTADLESGKLVTPRPKLDTSELSAEFNIDAWDGQNGGPWIEYRKVAEWIVYVDKDDTVIGYRPWMTEP